jgi:hypothetical protein
MKTVGVLNAYFNSDPETKVPIGKFAAEIKALDPDEKVELARLAAVELGVEFEESEAA